MLYALAHDLVEPGPVDLDPRGAEPGAAVRKALALLRECAWTGEVHAAYAPDDPASCAVAGLLRVALAEEGPALRVVLTPRIRLVPARGADAPARRVVELAPPPDVPLRRLDPDVAAEEVTTGLARLADPELLVVSADDLVGRPFSAASAALSGAARAWAVAGGVAVLSLGPRTEQQAAPQHGVAALTPEAVAHAIRGTPPGACRVALDVDWPRAVAAFPHVRELAAGLVRRIDVVDGVREELGRILGVPRPALRVPVRELGLDSVGASQLKVELERRFGVALPATLVFDCPTVEAMAERIAEALV